jgi:hypothetical protein
MCLKLLLLFLELLLELDVDLLYKASARATYERTSKGNATPITQDVIGVAWRLPDEEP